ncbi:MAG: hypothetical protein ACM3Q1_16025, partial [Bacteroidales bacterium]
MNHIQVIHQLARRVRVIAPALRRDAEKALLVEILLRKHDAIRKVRVVPELGSVAVHFDPRRLPPDNVLRLLDTVIGNIAQAPRR